MSEKLCICKACGQQIAKSAKICPHCGAKIKKAKPVLIAIIAIAFIAIIASAGNNEEPKAVESTTPPGTQSSSLDVTNATEATTIVTEATQEKNTNAFQIGEAAELKNVIATLLSVSESSGSSFNQPSEGNVFLLCEFEIQNNSNSELNISSMLSFEAYCDEYACNYSLGALLEKENSNQLDGTVAPGKKLKGIIGYEVPADWAELEIHFTPDVWSGKDIVFIAANN